MRRMTSVFSIALMATLLVFFVSCSKEGDQGPAGPAGPQGPAGAAGAQGPKGDSGTANVIYSDWLDVVFETDEDSANWVAEIPALKLTSDIVNQGEIKVYMNVGSEVDPAVFPLPWFNGNFIINPVFSVGAITLISNDDFGTIEEDGDKFFQFRYILIPGGVNGRLSKKIDWNNYEEVKKYLGLKN